MMDKTRKVACVIAVLLVLNLGYCLMKAFLYESDVPAVFTFLTAVILGAMTYRVAMGQQKLQENMEKIQKKAADDAVNTVLFEHRLICINKLHSLAKLFSQNSAETVELSQQAGELVIALQALFTLSAETIGEFEDCALAYLKTPKEKRAHKQLVVVLNQFTSLIRLTVPQLYSATPKSGYADSTRTVPPPSGPPVPAP